MSKITQEQRVIDYIRETGSITQRTSFNFCDIGKKVKVVKSNGGI